jgi:hypothetical protein
MNKIVIEFESKGNAACFFNNIISDYYYSVKNSEDKELSDQYDSIKFTIKGDPALNCECGYQH